jgi:hypothetical protein
MLMDQTVGAFDKVSQALSLGVVVGDGEDVNLDGHGRVGGQLVFAERAEDGRNVPRMD